MTGHDDPPPPPQVLETWKQIAAFLGRDERTAKRWEMQRGLPVHRAPGLNRSTVYAFASEIEAWRRRGPPISVEPGGSTAPVEAEPEPGPLVHPLPVHPPGRRIWAAAAGLAAALTLTAGAWTWSALTPARPVRAARDVAAAHDLCLRGLAAWNTRTPAGLSQGVDLFTQAIVRDPDYAPAYVGLADSFNLLRQFTLMSPAEAYPRAKAAAERALALDDHLAGAHRSLAFVEGWWSHDSVAARREFRRALELEPNSAQTHHWYATYLMAMGDFAGARAEIDRAQELDPDSVSILADKGHLLQVAGRDAEALPLLASAAASSPDFLSPHTYLASLYLTQRKGAQHLEELTRAAELLHDDAKSSMAAAGRRGWSAAGFEGMIREIDETQTRLYAAGRASAFDLARTAAIRGDGARALALLEVSVARGEPDVLGLLATREFAPIRRDPRFAALVRRMGLPRVQPL